MKILTIKTDNPEAEVGLYQDSSRLGYEIWTAHRQLAETLHTKIAQILRDHNLTHADIQAIACFQGPGSFTGLRIGLTVANALSYALQIPIVAQMNAKAQDDWIVIAIDRLQNGQTDVVAMPEYGADVHITLPRSNAAKV